MVLREEVDDSEVDGPPAVPSSSTSHYLVSSQSSGSIQRSPPSVAQDLCSGALRVVSLNLGGRNKNPLEFELKGDSSDIAVEATSMQRRACKALRDPQEGPLMMPATEMAVIESILAEIYDGAASVWHPHIQSLLRCETWGHVISFVQEKNSHLFNALNLSTLELSRPSVWENPASCLGQMSTTKDVATAFAGLLLFDVMSLCTARCAATPGDRDEVASEERTVPFKEIAKFAESLPSSNISARHGVAERFAAEAHVLLAQEDAASFFDEPGISREFMPPIRATDSVTAVYLRRDSFEHASDISGVVAQRMESLMDRKVLMDSQQAWLSTANHLAAVECRCRDHLGSFRACFVSLHCAESAFTGVFLEGLRDVLADYDVDFVAVGMDANCSSKDVRSFQKRLLKSGCEIGCSAKRQQCTVAKQRTAFQTQVWKVGELDVSHKDYIVSWGSTRARRGPTTYTPDVRTAYGVDQETMQCVRLPTVYWPLDHCGVATSFGRRLRRRRSASCSGRSWALIAFIFLVFLTPLISFERESPYGQPGTWHLTSWMFEHRVGICEGEGPCMGGWQPHGSSCYFATPRMGFPAVRSFCQELGGGLVSIGSELENNFVTSRLCPEGNFCYIGLLAGFDSHQPWWDSGEELNYTQLASVGKPFLPLFPNSRRREYVPAVLSNLPGTIYGCERSLIIPFWRATWRDVAWKTTVPAVAMLVSGGLLLLPRPPEQSLASNLLRLSFWSEFSWLFPEIWRTCFTDDLSSYSSVASVSNLLTAICHSATSLMALWLIIKRMGMLGSVQTLTNFYVAVAALVVSRLTISGLLHDSTAPLRPSFTVLLEFFLLANIVVLYLMLGARISSDLFHSWMFLRREASHGCNNRAGTALSTGIRAAKLHFFSVLAAISSGAARWASLLVLLCAAIAEETQPQWVLRLYTLARFLDSVTNNICAHGLAVTNMDAAVVQAKGISIEVAERARQQVEQHKLAVRMLKAAPTSAEQVHQLALLENKARASMGTEHERQEFLILQSAVQVEASRIHKLMRCVRVRAMTMPVRYQYLIDVPAFDGAARQPVPAQFSRQDAAGVPQDYFSWLYAEASWAQTELFQQLKQLLANFNGTPWPRDLGLDTERFPWTIWPGGPRGVSVKRFQRAEKISPGDLLIHAPPAAHLLAVAAAGTPCFVLEQTSKSHVRVHRSGMQHPEEVPLSDLRACSGGGVFIPGPKKKVPRCLDKIATDYEGSVPWPAAASLVDICRCMILLDDPYAAAVLVAYIRKNMRVVRLKNRFHTDVLETRSAQELQSMFYDASNTYGSPADDGGENSHPLISASRSSDEHQYRDISINVAVTSPRSGVPVVGEIQVTLSNLAILKLSEQKLYTIRRMKSPAELSKTHVFTQEGAAALPDASPGPSP